MLCRNPFFSVFGAITGAGIVGADGVTLISETWLIRISGSGFNVTTVCVGRMTGAAAGTALAKGGSGLGATAGVGLERGVGWFVIAAFAMTGAAGGAGCCV